MNANQTFRDWMEGRPMTGLLGSDVYAPCLTAVTWVKKRSLVQAWRDCPSGCWMAWWLYVYAGISASTHQDIFDSGSTFSGASYSDEQKRTFADALRRRYTPTGKRRAGR